MILLVGIKGNRLFPYVAKFINLAAVARFIWVSGQIICLLTFLIRASAPTTWVIECFIFFFKGFYYSPGKGKH